MSFVSPQASVAVRFTFASSAPCAGLVTLAVVPSIAIAALSLAQVMDEPFTPTDGSSKSSVTASVSPKSNSALSAATISVSVT